MIDVPRLKHQDRGLCRVDAGAIKRKVFGTPHEDNVGFDVVEDSRLVPEVLPREEHDGVIGRHGSRAPYIGTRVFPESGRYSQASRDRYSRIDATDPVVSLLQFERALLATVSVAQ